MCCNYGFLPTKSDPLFIVCPPISPSSSQIRLDPLPRISFPLQPSSARSLRSRVGSRPGFHDGPCSSESMVKEPLYGLESCCFYELLGIPETGSLLEIKQAYKQLARKYHPDVSPPDRVGEYTQRFIRVQEAYETLSDPKLRALYDIDRAKGLHFALCSRRRSQNFEEQVEEKGEWKSRWQAQVSELKKRSMYKDSGNTSWGARMRRQNHESSS